MLWHTRLTFRHDKENEDIFGNRHAHVLWHMKFVTEGSETSKAGGVID